MTSLHRHAAFVALATLFLFPFCALGQGSNVTSCIASASWVINSKGETPCLVAAQVRRACNVNVRYNSIPAGTHYLGPSGAQVDECFCSTATYMLVSACGACQGRTWANWTNWIVSCPVRFVTKGTGMPLPSGVDIPVWATLDPELMVNQTFDPVVARLALAQATTTTSSPATTPNPPASTSIPPPAFTLPPAESATSSSSSHVGAIAGGVVGGLVFLVAVGLLLFWFLLKRPKKVQKIDLTAQDVFERPNTAALNNVAGPSPPPMATVGGAQLPHHGRQLSSTSSESKGHEPVNSLPYGTHRPQKSVDSLSLSTYTGHVNLVPSGYTGAAEPHGG